MKNLFSRRDFVRLSALGFGALPGRFRDGTRPAAGAASDLKLGMASYTFRNFTRSQLIVFLKDLDISALNAKDIKDHLPMDSEEERKALADYAAAGITLHAGGVVSFAKDDDEDMRSKFEYAMRARLPVIVAGDPTPETLPRLEKFVKRYDIRIAIHNHGPEDPLWQSPLDVLKAVRNMDPRIGCCIDVGHTVRAGTDVVEAIHAVGTRIFNVHMKDLTDFHDKESQVPVGQGKMPVREIFDALIAVQYRGFIDLEYEVHPEDPMPGVAGSLAYMRNLLAKMASRRGS